MLSFVAELCAWYPFQNMQSKTRMKAQWPEEFMRLCFVTAELLQSRACEVKKMHTFVCGHGS